MLIILYFCQISKAAHVTHDIRGARSIIPEDIIFVVRKDPIKVQRLREFLQWRDLRKQNAKPSDDSASLATADTVEEDLTGITPLDMLSMDSTLLPVPSSSNIAISRSPSLAGRRRVERLPWEVIAGMIAETGANTDGLGESEEFVAEVEAESRDRLRRADVMTREMSREEYMEYAECRQASFTFKKAKKFRDWLNVAQFIDFRLNDDVIELLGFLAWDMVRVVTEKSLTLKNHAMGSRRKSTPIKENVRGESQCGLFESALEKTAITPEDIQTALRQLENAKVNPARILLPRGRPTTSLKLYQ